MVICCSRGRQVVTVVADQQHNNYTTPIYPDLSDSSVHVCLNTHAAVSTVALAHPGARSYTRHSAEILLENAEARCC